MGRSFQVLSDARGTVETGFVAHGVFYVRVVDFVSAGLGIRCGTQLRQQLADAQAVSAFVDISKAKGGDFAARSAIMRALLANRRQLAHITILAVPGPAATRARSLAAILGTIEMVDSPALFQAKMLEAAPAAPTSAPVSGRMPIARSVQPRARSARPRARSGTDG